MTTILNKFDINNIFNTLHEGIIVHDKETSIVYFNAAALDILQLSADTMLGKNASDDDWIFIDKDGKVVPLEKYPVMITSTTKKPITNMIIGLKHTNDNVVWVQLNSVIMFDENGDVEYIIITFVDVTSQKNALQYSYFKTYYNTLTKLPNSSSFKESTLENENFFILAELQNFDHLTQYFGEKISDEIVLFVSKQLSSKLQEGDQLFHIDKTKFAFNMRSQDDDKTFFYNFLKNISENELYFEKIDMDIQMIFGITYESVNTIVTAQIALEEAKRKKSLYAIYNKKSDLNKIVSNEIFWSRALKYIIANNGLKPAFQPIINNTTLEIDKYEVLMRVEYDNKIYYPDTFLGLAKRLNMYKNLTILLIENVFDKFKNEQYRFSINLSTEDLMSFTIQELLLRKIKNFHTPENITIEIIESEGIDNFNEVNKFLSKIKLYGCEIAIDDFGSGYSNFEYILKLDADYIKIDGTLVKNIDESLDNKDIVTSIATFAKLKNIKTIAEYVSSKEKYDILKEIGIDYSQGFYFGKPEFTLKELPQNITEETQLKKDSKYKQLIYASKRTELFSKDTIKSTFLAAQERNNERGISGFVVYSNNCFLQIIEGSEESINTLYNNIVSDSRHTNILLLGFKQLSHRDFEKWNLGLIDDNKIIQNYLYKNTGKKLFLPHEYDYDFALNLLKNIAKVV